MAPLGPEIIASDDYLVLCLPLPLAAPVAVILLVCISSPIYLVVSVVSN